MTYLDGRIEHKNSTCNSFFSKDWAQGIDMIFFYWKIEHKDSKWFFWLKDWGLKMIFLWRSWAQGLEIDFGLIMIEHEDQNDFFGLKDWA